MIDWTDYFGGIAGLMDSDRADIEEKLLTKLQQAKDRLLAQANAAEKGGDESAFSEALAAYALVLQTFTKFVLYGRLPEDK